MPTYGIVPYELKIRKKRDKDTFWDLTSLQQKDPSFPQDNFLDFLEAFLTQYKGTMEKVKEKDKSFVIENYNREDNIIEGIIATGNYGYESELRNINTGSTTHQKKVDEAEVIPYYFLLYLPETIAGKSHNQGKEAVIIFQQMNGRSAKTLFYDKFNRNIVDKTTNSVFYMKPVAKQQVLDKIIDSKRVKQVEFELKKMPTGSDEKRVQLIEGMDTQETGTQLLVLKPKRGGSLTGFSKKAKELKRDDSNFATIVSDDVTELKATIKNDSNKTEKFSLLDDELRMKKILEPKLSDLDKGLPKTQYLCDESCDMINDIYPDGVVKKIDHTTKL